MFTVYKFRSDNLRDNRSDNLWAKNVNRFPIRNARALMRSDWLTYIYLCSSRPCLLSGTLKCNWVSSCKERQAPATHWNVHECHWSWVLDVKSYNAALHAPCGNVSLRRLPTTNDAVRFHIIRRLDKNMLVPIPTTLQPIPNYMIMF